MRSGLRDDPVGHATEACRAYWEHNGVPGARIAEMSLELDLGVHRRGYRRPPL